MVFSTLVLQFLLKKISKRQKEDDTFLKKKKQKRKTKWGYHSDICR